jgi:hypothetical protein
MLTLFSWIALFAALISSAGVLLHRDWRWGIGFLAVQYLVIFWFVQTRWPVTMAASKLVTGWMACAILGVAKLTADSAHETEAFWPHSRLFRLFIAGIVISSTFPLSLRASSWLGLNLPVTWGSLLICGMGLLQLGISTQPLRVILGLLTVISGFEILYAVVESSILVAALLSVINLGLALSGAYFLYRNEEETT